MDQITYNYCWIELWMDIIVSRTLEDCVQANVNVIGWSVLKIQFCWRWTHVGVSWLTVNIDAQQQSSMLHVAFPWAVCWNISVPLSFVYVRTVYTESLVNASHNNILTFAAKKWDQPGSCPCSSTSPPALASLPPGIGRGECRWLLLRSTIRTGLT